MNVQILQTLIMLMCATSALADVHPVELIKWNILSQNAAYENLRELTKDIGPRVSGSENEKKAVMWAERKLKSFGLSRVFLGPVEAPHWERGQNEMAYFEHEGARVPLAVAALGRSAGTPGIDAGVIEVQSLDELTNLGASAVKGKIVFFNRPMDPQLSDTFEAYGRAVDQRTRGPALASTLGAVATLVRSMTTQPDDDHPHTGGTSFRAGTPIPAAALSTHAANVLSSHLKQNKDLIIHLELSAQNLPAVTSYNVIGEITGSEKPEDIVLVGAHLDSWDLGEGAHDDGAGVAQTMEVCRAISSLKLTPKRTIRCVLFAAEEFGGIGGVEYARQAKQRGERHIMAIESDRGGFAPQSISIDGTSEEVRVANLWEEDFKDLGMTAFFQGEAGTDVEPLKELGTLTMELIPDSTHYFDYHHAATDRCEAVDPGSLAKGAAALAVIAWRYSEAP